MKSIFKQIIVTFLTVVPLVKIHAQSGIEISFDSTQKISRNKSEDKIYPVVFSAKLGTYKDSGDYKLMISVSNNSDFSKKYYKLDFNEKKFADIDEKDKTKNIVYLTLYKDSLEDRTRTLILKLDVYKSGTLLKDSVNKGKFKEIIINVEGSKVVDSLKSFSYLAYVGTNFDLVDGIKAKNLFFATNIFLPPLKKGAVGMHLYLYGNRTMTTTDTTGNIVRVTKILKTSDTTYKQFTEQSTLVRTTVSDNIGAYVSPIINLWSASSRDNRLQLYYTPSLEFIWRRTNLTSIYTNDKNIDSTVIKAAIPGNVDFESKFISNVNEFAFKFGFIGLTIVHESESKNISVRIHMCAGYSSIYSPFVNAVTKGSATTSTISSGYTTTPDIFFSGRTWITEGVTGITLQAEITNTLKYPRPFYGVTLSKAINFQNLGKFFQPLTNRN